MNALYIDVTTPAMQVALDIAGVLLLLGVFAVLSRRK